MSLSERLKKNKEDLELYEKLAQQNKNVESIADIQNFVNNFQYFKSLANSINKDAKKLEQEIIFINTFADMKRKNHKLISKLPSELIFLIGEYIN